MEDKFAIAFRIGSLEIHWYSIFALIAIVVACSFIVIQAKRRLYPIRPLEYFAIIALVFGVIGARGLFLIGNHKDIHSFLDAIAIWRGGIAIEGGVFLVLVIGIIYFWSVKRKYGISMWNYFDIILPNIFIGQCIGRWGNFFNQEILGPITTRHSFPINILPHWIVNHLHLVNETSDIVRQPFFLYESFFTFWFWIFVAFFLKTKNVEIQPSSLFHDTRQKFLNKFRTKKNEEYKKIKKKHFIKRECLETGSKGLLWFILYGALRLCLEPFRDQQDILELGSVYISEIISGVYFGVALILFIINQKIIKIKWWEEKIKIL